ncbi:MAG: response regulator [Polyangiaceae bacterium]
MLIVDDDADIRETISLALEDEGYEVAAAANGADALRHLRTALRPPNLILLDLMMPVMDGIEFRTRQREDALFAGIPVLVITASGNAKEQVKLLAVDGIIKKPIALQTLLDTVRRSLHPQ